MRTIAHVQPALDVDAVRNETVDLGEQRIGVEHDTVADRAPHAFVQNALLNLPGMSDGSVTVVDLQKQQVVKSMDTLKDAGFNPNCIVLLPAWYNPAGH